MFQNEIHRIHTVNGGRFCRHETYTGLQSCGGDHRRCRGGEAAERGEAQQCRPSEAFTHHQRRHGRNSKAPSQSFRVHVLHDARNRSQALQQSQPKSFRTMYLNSTIVTAKETAEIAQRERLRFGRHTEGGGRGRLCLTTSTNLVGQRRLSDVNRGYRNRHPLQYHHAIL
ncbi:unnamed protein product [Nippostrongylus brasiliensis]|uniref:Uncharacterized protein n=1 Tax=Nippostrongylus brasiliensis TaxID=27835 RepID=A0A0N4XYX5_NIPBR|nr:unnamed protein product [Nippostrongylus brasiliensis]